MYLLAQFGLNFVKQTWEKHHPLIRHNTKHPQPEHCISALQKFTSPILPSQYISPNDKLQNTVEQEGFTQSISS
jgi:hypothetical protein